MSLLAKPDVHRRDSLMGAIGVGNRVRAGLRSVPCRPFTRLPAAGTACFALLGRGMRA
jgi:hypothetical protein